MTAGGNPAWRDGIGNLPWGYEFNKDLKNKVQKRDSKVCKLCGDNKHLLVHHIDYNKLNNREDNLITLCFQCHGKTNYKREFWQNKLSKIISKIYGKGI
jgi:5-methylcytosine-specific restriction endonuclease McrA